MGHNSFLLKGWCITLVGALFALVFKESNTDYLYISSVILIFFWILDGFYLFKERLFIKVFDYVRNLEDEKVDFSMSTKSFECNCNWSCAVFSKTLNIFYGGILMAHLLVIYLI